MFSSNPSLTWGMIGLVACYLVIAGLLVNALLFSRIRWWIKLSGAAVTAVFFWVSYQTFDDVFGWPTEADLPDRFELVAAVIDEPDDRSRSLGAIYLWVVRLPGEGPVSEVDIYDPMVFSTELDPRQMPRAYRIAYDRTLHKKVHEAQLKIEDDIRQVGVRNPPSEKGEEADRFAYSFFDRPEPVLAPQEF